MQKERNNAPSLEWDKKIMDYTPKWKPKTIELPEEKKREREKSLGPPGGQNLLYFIEKVLYMKEKSDR